MRNWRPTLPFSPLSLCGGAVGVLLVVYIGLIAAVMSYAALTIEFSQSVRNNSASVAALEQEYLTAIGRITATDYTAQGYVAPAAKTFVKKTSATALR